MRINSTHAHSDRGVDPYFTPIEGIRALMKIEALPKNIWEPAAGNGAIVNPLRDAGHNVLASDIVDYGGVKGFVQRDFLTSSVKDRSIGIVTNPPYKLAAQFLEHALSESDYVALLLRLNFLEGSKRKAMFEANPPARVWVSSRRLPMMHRLGWTGNQAPSNTCYAWFVWAQPNGKPQLNWFDWRQI